MGGASQAPPLDGLKRRFPALVRSLDVYYGDAARDAAMAALYRSFVPDGGLAFDIGSHVGDRIGVLRQLGARVVALEPQPDCAAVIREIYGADTGVAIIEAACGRAPGTLRLFVNSANPTVSTASPGFVDAARGAAGWEEQQWDGDIEVSVTTLDALIAEHGRPDFVKIDVEGFEADVLAGLSAALPALSFEFTTIAREGAIDCLNRLAELGDYRFDIALGETHALAFGPGAEIDAQAMAAHIGALPHAANSGDVYAVLQN